ncbi:nicotinamide riboside transporter PnuC [Inhella gelatinilytica]|uniref:Nicotinamide riboside transporter PnuC n=1 Tax=Inhella gelatinilytica TaxID=2795030 RepID=A0A931IVW3_9BURK|nr:nicotinamide riboside transporter PnuC [Inhella gelatinilytica]MBH9552897.1 nicotinamide mononucleotide transporter [Inhella gelatinilytica]
MDALLQPAWTLVGTPFTWLELLAFLLSIAMVLANMRQWLVGWPLAAASSLLYGLLFFHGQLYGEAALQLFFVAMAIWGFLQWWQGRAQSTLTVRRMAPTAWAWSLGSIAVGAPLLGWVLDHYTDSPLPYWDAVPTVASVVATVQLGRKYLENWGFWVAVNAVSVILFSLRAYWLTVLLYAAFIPLSVLGWRAWARAPRMPRP